MKLTKEDTSHYTDIDFKKLLHFNRVLHEYYKRVHGKRDIQFILGNPWRARLLRVIGFILV